MLVQLTEGLKLESQHLESKLDSDSLAWLANPSFPWSSQSAQDTHRPQVPGGPASEGNCLYNCQIILQFASHYRPLGIGYIQITNHGHP